VLFFAQLKDLAGCSECSLDAHEPLTAEELWSALASRFPGIEARRPVVRLARNWDYAGPETVFLGQDEVALIPPVSGG
jgi:molybdopterin converting factor subunit 1